MSVPITFDWTTQDPKLLKDLIGYLNFSGGRPDPSFQRALNELWRKLLPGAPGGPDPKPVLQSVSEALRDGIRYLSASTTTFSDCKQAEQVALIAFQKLLPAYLDFHSDSLFHWASRRSSGDPAPQPGSTENHLPQPFLIARFCEAVLKQGPPWVEQERIVEGALRYLNDFLGHRPVAVLEGGQEMQPYEKERLAVVPIYFSEAGAACGRYEQLINSVLDHLRNTPADLLAEAYFDLSRLDEIAFDPRAYDHQHPMFKRTNYMFGEWDPHRIDSSGRYRRFIIRHIILLALEHWMASAKHPSEEILFEASAVLCGTILMASTISGSGPGAHDSTVSLGSLLPKVARQRDHYYSRLLGSLKGSMGDRLRREAQLAKQPFGRVRQHLNLFVAGLGSRQVQHTHLAYLYARMGYSDASEEQARIIPSASARFECGIEWRITAAHVHLNRDELDRAVAFLPDLEDLLRRGIQCGALADPWNILGFQGNYPLFQAREDSVHDPRIERLLELVENLFALLSRTLSCAAALGREETRKAVAIRFERLTDWWDRFASTTVSGLPKVFGKENREAAERVAIVLADWHRAGTEAGNLSFWKEHLGEFTTAKSYALVLQVLLGKPDYIAAMALLIQWLGQAETVGLESGGHSFHRLVLRWWRALERDAVRKSEESGTASPSASLRILWPTINRFFSLMEANAGSFWKIPMLEQLLDSGPVSLDENDEEEENLFQAAYDQVVFRDSANDGEQGEVSEGEAIFSDSELDHLQHRLESRLKFVITISRLWQLASGSVASAISRSPQHRRSKSKSDAIEITEDQRGIIEQWKQQALIMQKDLVQLMDQLHQYKITPAGSDPDSLMEYDRQLQVKYSLLHNMVHAHVGLHEATWLHSCFLPEEDQNQEDWEVRTIEVYRAIVAGRVSDVTYQLPELKKLLMEQPALYVPFEKGGTPEDLLRSRTVQAVIRNLLLHLPRLGLFREAWDLLKTVQKMETMRQNRYGLGRIVITEFDKLFHAAFRSTVECLVWQADAWFSSRFTTDQFVELLYTVAEQYIDVWFEHSRSTRLSSLEDLIDEQKWRRVGEFIRTYGGDFFHAQMLTLGNIRGILHHGVDRFLEYLAEESDPLRPYKLIQDLSAGVVPRETAINYLELVFRITVEKFDRFLEYNSTTTQSDYGEQYHQFLDFLRLEAGYERQAWILSPLVLVHEVLVRTGKHSVAQSWRHRFDLNTRDESMVHVKKLRRLEKKYGMKLPGISDLIEERFTKPLSLDRIVALVQQAMREARDSGAKKTSFPALSDEVTNYLTTTIGSGVDIPNWLRTLEHEVNVFNEADVDETDSFLPDPRQSFRIDAFSVNVRQVPVTLDEFQRQLENWMDPPRRRRGK